MSSNSTYFGDGFPYSDVHNLNLDWIIQVCKQMQVLIGQVSDGLEIHVKDDSGAEVYVFTVKSNGIYVTRPDGGTPLYYNLSTGQLHAPTFDGQSILTATARITGQLRAGSLVLDNPLPITGGGTGATTATGARNALGAVAKAGDTMTGNLSISGDIAPSYYMIRSDGTPMGMLYSLASSGRVVLRGFNTDGTHYNGFRIPDTSAVTVNADYDILTTKAPVSVAQGGTGATNATDALKALGLGYTLIRETQNDLQYQFNYDVIDSSFSNSLTGYRAGNMVYINGQVKILSTYTSTWTTINLIPSGLWAPPITMGINTKSPSVFTGFLPNCNVTSAGALQMYIRGDNLAGQTITFFGTYFIV